ncbi:ABC transporter ATP-binding protein [Candidatus Woesearchaeota archaeon]|nr:ABC transporter ATP-binding protein [Candidatus Woesearchaeota archaeon]
MMNPDIPALTVSGLMRYHGSLQAVKGVSFSVGRGEFFGLLGPNGAGKSTTLALLCGLLKPHEGQILIDGQPAHPRTAAQKRKLGLVPQDFAFYPALTARDNLAFFARLHGLQGERLKTRIDYGLDIAQLAHRARQPVGEFSGGMKRRLNIAIGLLHEPELLILDEPTVGVDAQSRHAILETLRALNQQGLTLVYSTHYLEEAHRLCQRVAILDQGRILALDTPENLIKRFASGLIEVELSSPPDASVLQGLAAGFTVLQTAETPTRLRFEIAHPQTALPGLLQVLAAHGLTLSGLKWQMPDLETVFLKLTGHQTRD